MATEASGKPSGGKGVWLVLAGLPFRKPPG